MQGMTIEQLRAASNAGGVSGVTLIGEDGAFLVRIATRNGPGAVLVKARDNEPRRFGNPLAALDVLRDIGITAGRVDAPAYDSAGEKHETAAYGSWLAAEVQRSIDDPRASIPHDEVMSELDADIAALQVPKRKPA